MQRGFRIKSAGFSLLELLMVTAIVGILASIAYPAYSTHLHRGRRSDALQALTLIQLSQEHYRSNHPAYAESLSAIGIRSDTSAGGHYKIALIGESTAVGYSATATASGVQSGDTVCRVMTISIYRGTAIMRPVACWGM